MTSAQYADMEELQLIKSDYYISDIKLQVKILRSLLRAYSMLGLINRNSNLLCSNSFVMLYKSMVRSHLEYANDVESSYRRIN